MAKQGGRVQLEQSNMRLALNMAKMVQGGFLCATIEGTQYLIKKTHTKVWEEKKGGVEIPGNRKVKAVIERHLVMVHENQTDSCHPCQDIPAKNPQAPWRCKATWAPPQQPARPPHGTPHAPPGDNPGAQNIQIKGMPPGYVYIPTPLTNDQFSNLDVYAKDCKHDKDFNPDLLTDEGTTTGLYTLCCVVMPLTSILQTRAAYWANLQVKMSIDWKKQDFWVYHYVQLADTLKNIWKDIFISIIKEQCIDKGQSTWKW